MKTTKSCNFYYGFLSDKRDFFMSMNIYFNPLDRSCKNVTGAVKQGDKLQLNIFLLQKDMHFNVINGKEDVVKEENCIASEKRGWFHLQKDGENIESFLMENTSYGWRISLEIKEIGLYYYTFEIEGEGFISCGDMENGVISDKENGFLLTVCSKDYQTPDWFKGGVMYQIFPDRFCKNGTMPDIKRKIFRQDWGGIPSYKPNAQGKVLNNDFFGGNFKGIQSKLGYLHDLGVTVIYLNPIFEAASNHRYDTSDYMNIDPVLGRKEDFCELVNAAREYDIRIILDGVFNHTGDDSVYFNKYGHYPSVGAYQSKDSPYYNWYSFQEFPEKYSSWWGIDILPEVNENSEDYQHFIFGEDGVLKYWLQYGIGGYRLDVADELPDFFLKKLRKSVKEGDPNAIIIGEVWEDASNKIAYSKRREYLQGYELDSVMNYPLKDGIIRYIQTGDESSLLRIIRALINHYPKQTLDCLMNILGTHDTARILTVLGGIYCQNKDEMASEKAYLTPELKEIAIKKLKMAAVLQYTLPGVPCVYYGDEIGMEGHIDPFCRRCFDWEHLNNDLIEFYTKLGWIRKEFKDIFKNGEFKELFVNDGLIYYKRKNDYGEIYVYTNNSEKSIVLKLDQKYHDLLQNRIYENELIIKSNSYGIFKKI